ncbi:hypothetical protein ABZW18_27120 [Streptomyces sp. NPDC004647]|uniref:hypothetical protein n=1 Tax=Streptomyces sp. NPDC004647 TaxID=3154671 RepID=UPI0033AE156D
MGDRDADLRHAVDHTLPGMRPALGQHHERARRDAVWLPTDTGGCEPRHAVAYAAYLEEPNGDDGPHLPAESFG